MALLFKASPLLSNISLASIDPHGRFVAAQCNLCGGQVTLASVYAPVERQERAPFFLQCLVPALPARTPLVLGGDWNCVAGDQDLVGGQTGTRQHGFHSGLLPLQQALGLQDAFRHLHPDAHEFTHTATSGSSSARIDRWLVSDSLLSAVSAATVSDTEPGDHYGVSSWEGLANPRWPSCRGRGDGRDSHALWSDPGDVLHALVAADRRLSWATHGDVRTWVQCVELC